MKKIIFFLFLAVCTSCSGDDPQSEDPGLDGEWSLLRIACYCPFDDSIDLSAYTIRFEASKKVVHISNPTDDYIEIAASGTYKYELEGNIIKIEGVEPYKYEIDDSELILTYIDDLAIADDEFVFTYQRK